MVFSLDSLIPQTTDHKILTLFLFFRFSLALGVSMTDLGLAALQVMPGEVFSEAH